MTKQLAELLQRLSEIEPADCQKTGHYYGIGEYVFKPSNDGIVAYCDNGDLGPASGPPALAWLRDAVERECERRGWDYSDHTSITQGRYHFAAIYNKPGSLEAVHSPNEHITTSAHALLAAFVAVCEAAAPANR